MAEKKSLTFRAIFALGLVTGLAGGVGIGTQSPGQEFDPSDTQLLSIVTDTVIDASTQIRHYTADGVERSDTITTAGGVTPKTIGSPHAEIALNADSGDSVIIFAMIKKA